MLHTSHTDSKEPSVFNQMEDLSFFSSFLSNNTMEPLAQPQTEDGLDNHRHCLQTHRALLPCRYRGQDELTARPSSFDTTYGTGQKTLGQPGWRPAPSNMNTSLRRSKSFTERFTACKEQDVIQHDLDMTEINRLWSY